MTTLLDIDKQVFSPPELGCVLYLPGLPGGGSRIYDRSPYGNHGTITGATWVRLPSGLWCLSFDGTDDYVDCAGLSIWDNLSEGTVTLWLNPTELSLNHPLFYIQDAGEVTNLFGFHIMPDDTIRVLCKGASDHYRGTISPSIVTSTWYQLGFTVNGDGNKLFWNGAEQTITYASGASTNPQFIDDLANIDKCFISRMDIGGTIQHAKCGIALARLCNRALSALEIQNHFNREKHLFGVW